MEADGLNLTAVKVKDEAGVETTLDAMIRDLEDDATLQAAVCLYGQGSMRWRI